MSTATNGIATQQEVITKCIASNIVSAFSTKCVTRDYFLLNYTTVSGSYLDNQLVKYSSISAGTTIFAYKSIAWNSIPSGGAITEMNPTWGEIQVFSDTRAGDTTNLRFTSTGTTYTSQSQRYLWTPGSYIGLSVSDYITLVPTPPTVIGKIMIGGVEYNAKFSYTGASNVTVNKSWTKETTGILRVSKNYVFSESYWAPNITFYFDVAKAS